MIETSIGAIEHFFTGFFPGCYSTKQYSSISDNKTTRFNPDLKVFIVSISELTNLLEELFYVHKLFARSIFHSHPPSNVDMLNIGKSVWNPENLFCCLSEYFLIFFLQIGTDMLMETNNFNVIFLGNLKNFFKILFSNTKFVLGACRNDMVIFSCSHVRINPDKYLLSCEFFSKILKSLKSAHINYNSLL